MDNLRKIFALFTLVAIFGCSSTPPANPDTVPIVILHNNDVHGHLWPMKRADGELRGGIAALGSLVDKIREETNKRGGVALLLSAGDVNTGVPDADYFFGEPSFKAMDAIPYDAMVLGNHEFDNGVEKLLLQKSWVKFPIVSANILNERRKALVPGHAILERNGIKIGVLGLTTDSLKTLTVPKDTKHLNVISPIEAAKKEVLEIRNKGADFIIALTHIGITHSSSHRPGPIRNDDIQLSEANLGIPLIVGGHSHTLLTEGFKNGNTLIVQSGEKGEHLGRVDLEWSKKDHRIVSSKATVIRINPADGEKEEIKKILVPFEEKTKAIFGEIVGRTNVLLDGEREHTRSQETNLGNLISDIIRNTAETDVAVYNGGGIRGSIQEGPIQLRDVQRVFPFRNTVVKATFTGMGIRELLSSSLGSKSNPAGSFLHVSGMRYIVKNGKVAKVFVNDKELKPDQKVSLSTTSFVMAGGDNLEIKIAAAKVEDTGVLVADAVVKHLRQFRSISPKVEGRIQIQE